MAVKFGTQHMAGFETWCVQCRSLFLEVLCLNDDGLKGVRPPPPYPLVWCGAVAADSRMNIVNENILFRALSNF